MPPQVSTSLFRKSVNDVSRCSRVHVQIECRRKPLTSCIPLPKAVSTTLHKWHMPILTHVYYYEWIHMAVNLDCLPSVLTAECIFITKILRKIDFERRERQTRFNAPVPLNPKPDKAKKPKCEQNVVCLCVCAKCHLNASIFTTACPNVINMDALRPPLHAVAAGISK